MARITELKKIQKYHSEEEMRNALRDFIEGKYHLRIPVDDDDPDIVLGDAISELVEARAIIQELAEDDPYSYNDNNGSMECLFCHDFYGFGPDVKHTKDHDADCLIARVRTFLKLKED